MKKKDGSTSLGLLRKGKTRITAKFHMTDLVIFSHSRERKTLSYSRVSELGFYPNNNKVIRRPDLGLKSHLKDQRSGGLILRSLDW